jgi:AbrB family transcriptional regulator, transcriptional pleiotropic regulator of transition state genes
MNTYSTGIVRQVDQLGRIVLPKELRDMLGIGVTDGMEIFIDDRTIVLKKYAPACIFCNNADGVVYFKNKGICKSCLDESTFK